MKKLLFVLLCISLGNVVFAKASIEQTSRKMVQDMSQKEKLGQLIMIDFRKWQEKPLTELNPEIKKVIEDYKLGGIILFRENLANTEQTIRLIDDLQNSSQTLPLLISTDQEGGYVTRLQQGTEMPGNMALGAGGDLELTKKVGTTIGKELKALGINFNFAPVVDVNSNQKNPIIGVRSFGDNPQQVGATATAYIDGLKSIGIISTVKHFPGHGNTVSDTHIGLATVDYSREQWEAIDKVPFKMAIDNGVEAIMTAHVIVPALDDTKVVSKKDGFLIGTPATLSKPIMTDLVRKELGFEGVIVSDALNMRAITDNFGDVESVIKGILAGGDIMLMPVIIRNKEDIKKLENLYDEVLEEMEKNKILRRRVEESAERIVSLKLKTQLVQEVDIEERIKNAKTIVGSENNKAIEKEATEKGITLLKNENILPFKLKENTKVLLVAETKTRGNTMENELLQLQQNISVEKISTDYKDGLTPEIKSGIKNADYIVVATYNLKNNTEINKIIEYANKENRKLATISTRNPYDIIHTPKVKANIAIYGITGFDTTNAIYNRVEANVRAGIRTLFLGNNSTKLVVPTGKLPVNIQNENGDIVYKAGYGLTY